MDLRRPPRSSSGGVKPKIRQVGFFTPDASAASEAPAAAPAAAAAAAVATQQAGAAAGSPPASDLSPGRFSPVMIPPPRHADVLAPGSPSPAAPDAVLATSAPVRSSARFDAASEIADDDSWSRAPSAAELGYKADTSSILTGDGCVRLEGEQEWLWGEAEGGGKLRGRDEEGWCGIVLQ